MLLYFHQWFVQIQLFVNSYRDACECTGEHVVVKAIVGWQSFVAVAMSISVNDLPDD